MQTFHWKTNKILDAFKIIDLYQNKFHITMHCTRINDWIKNGVREKGVCHLILTCQKKSILPAIPSTRWDSLANSFPFCIARTWDMVGDRRRSVRRERCNGGSEGSGVDRCARGQVQKMRGIVRGGGQSITREADVAQQVTTARATKR